MCLCAYVMACYTCIIMKLCLYVYIFEYDHDSAGQNNVFFFPSACSTARVPNSSNTPKDWLQELHLSHYTAPLLQWCKASEWVVQSPCCEIFAVL